VLSSAFGYVLWSSVLKQLKLSTAAIIQLSVPVIATLGGVMFLDEQLTLSMTIACTMILLGIYIKVQAKRQ